MWIYLHLVSHLYYIILQCPACLDNYPTIKELQYASGGEGATKHAHLVRVKCGNTDCGQVHFKVKNISSEIVKYFSRRCWTV